MAILTGRRSNISIHALLTEGDFVGVCVVGDMIISIHALLTEGDLSEGSSPPSPRKFQSTPSSRRVTEFITPIDGDEILFQSTPSSRRVTVGM